MIVENNIIAVENTLYYKSINSLTKFYQSLILGRVCWLFED